MSCNIASPSTTQTPFKAVLRKDTFRTVAKQLSKLCKKYLCLTFFNYFCFIVIAFIRTCSQIHAFIIQAEEMPVLLTVNTRIFVHVTQHLVNLDASLSHLKNLNFELQMQLHNMEILHCSQYLVSVMTNISFGFILQYARKTQNIW